MASYSSPGAKRLPRTEGECFALAQADFQKSSGPTESPRCGPDSATSVHIGKSRVWSRLGWLWDTKKPTFTKLWAPPELPLHSVPSAQCFMRNVFEFNARSSPSPQTLPLGYFHAT